MLTAALKFPTVFHVRHPWSDRATVGMESGTSSAKRGKNARCIERIRRNRFGVIVAVVAVACLCTVAVGILLTFLYRSEKIHEPFAWKQRTLSFGFVPLEESVNLSVNPCEDFYEFACGRWKDHIRTSDTSRGKTAFSLLDDSISDQVKHTFLAAASSGQNERLPDIVNSAIKFYQYCVEAVEHGTQYSGTVTEFLSEVGGWPILGDRWHGEPDVWVRMVSLVQRRLGMQTIMGIYVTADDTNSTNNIIIIKAPDVEKKYLDNSFTTLLLYCVVTSLNSSLMQDEIISDIRNMILLEDEIKELRRHVSETTESKKMSLAELQKLIPKVNWLQLISLLTDKILCPKSCISEAYEVRVADIPYLKKVAGLFADETKQRAVANLLGWYVIDDLAMILPDALQLYARYSNLTSTEILTSAKDECYKKVSEKFVFAMDYLYVRSNPHFVEEKSSELVHYLKDAFISIVQFSRLFNDETKARIISKLGRIHKVVGYNKSLYSKMAMDQLFSRLPELTDDVIRNYINIAGYFTANKIHMLKSKNTRESYIPPRTVSYVGAYYDLAQNTIVFPLSLHNPPFYYISGLEYLNFGAIGTVIGHEMTHGFDRMGLKRDENGNLNDWLPAGSAAKFSKQFACFECQFSKYVIPGSNMTVNGSKTLNENIADTIGLQLAYLAYKNWQKDHGTEPRYSGLEIFTPEQMFFISFGSVWCADVSRQMDDGDTSYVHSPQKWRVIGSLSNSEHFSKVFGCADGSPMNPKEKCHVW